MIGGSVENRRFLLTGNRGARTPAAPPAPIVRNSKEAYENFFDYQEPEYTRPQSETESFTWKDASYQNRAPPPGASPSIRWGWEKHQASRSNDPSKGVWGNLGGGSSFSFNAKEVEQQEQADAATELAIAQAEEEGRVAEAERLRTTRGTTEYYRDILEGGRSDSGWRGPYDVEPEIIDAPSREFGSGSGRSSYGRGGVWGNLSQGDYLDSITAPTGYQRQAGYTRDGEYYDKWVKGDSTWTPNPNPRRNDP